MKKLLTITLVITALSSCCDKKKVIKGTVASHATSSSKYGQIHYHTIIKCEDGVLRDNESMAAYVKPVGAEISVEICVCE